MQKSGLCSGNGSCRPIPAETSQHDTFDRFHNQPGLSITLATFWEFKIALRLVSQTPFRALLCLLGGYCALCRARVVPYGGYPSSLRRDLGACGKLCCTKRLGDSLCESSMIARGHEQLVTHTGAMVNSGVYGRFHAAVVSGWGCLMPSLKLMPSMTSAR